MPKAIAKTTLQICRSPGVTNDRGRVEKAASVELVEAGSVFSMDNKTLTEFVSAGHAERLPRPETKQSVSTSKKEKPEDPDERDGPPDEGNSEDTSADAGIE